MKKQLLFAVLAAAGALVCSCKNEKEKEVPTIPQEAPGTVSVVMNGVATRAADVPAIQTFEYELGTDADGFGVNLEETVTELGTLGSNAPETRGTPVYTENVTKVYGKSFNGFILGASGIIVDDGAFEIMEDVQNASGRNPWRRKIGFDPWEKSDPLTFFLRMPAATPGATNATYDHATGSVEFDFTTPETAEHQYDFLLASRRIGKSVYLDERQNNGGADILFHHALTGVKFAIGNNETKAGNRQPANKTETFITSVSITGLKDKGHATFVPTEPAEGATASASSITWEDLEETTRTAVYTQTYGLDDIQDFKQGEGDKVGAADSFYEGGQDRNLNKDDASLTFWFIPQEITDDLKVTVKMKVWNGKYMGEEKTITLNLGELILAQEIDANKVWKAGQLRTFTLRPFTVDIHIEDELTEYVKSDVVIRNTGNVREYVRVNIIANWFGKVQTKQDVYSADYTVMNGYAAATGDTQVEAWNDKDGLTSYGTFVGLPLIGATTPVHNWIRHDKYYYYTQPIGPGNAVPTTDPLFTSYTILQDNIPDFWIPDLWGTRRKAKEVHLEMDIAVQAIAVPVNTDGTEASYDAAWKAALNVDDLNNL